MRDPLDKELMRPLAPYSEVSIEERERILDVVRRFVRTPLFVARYFEIDARSGEQALQSALDTRDRSDASLSEKIDAFLKFIAKRSSPREREDYLDALHRMQPGMRGESHRDKDDDLSQLTGGSLMPNIRLANGLVRQETTLRLMLAFNTPFFPEALVGFECSRRRRRSTPQLPACHSSRSQLEPEHFGATDRSRGSNLARKLKPSRSQSKCFCLTSAEPKTKTISSCDGSRALVSSVDGRGVSDRRSSHREVYRPGSPTHRSSRSFGFRSLRQIGVTFGCTAPLK
jgi:hypothetical protein